MKYPFGHSDLKQTKNTTLKLHGSTEIMIQLPVLFSMLAKLLEFTTRTDCRHAPEIEEESKTPIIRIKEWVINCTTTDRYSTAN